MVASPFPPFSIYYSVFLAGLPGLALRVAVSSSSSCPIPAVPKRCFGRLRISWVTAHPVCDEPPAVPQHVLSCSRLDLANKSTSYGSSTHGGPAPCRVPEAGDGITRRAAIWPPHAISGGTWGGGTVLGMEARRWAGSGEEETPASTPAPTATSGYEHRVMPIHYNILGSADMGCGLTAMGLACGVVTIRTKLRLRCQGIEEV
jgi:hypothetical protein